MARKHRRIETVKGGFRPCTAGAGGRRKLEYRPATGSRNSNALHQIHEALVGAQRFSPILGLQQNQQALPLLVGLLKAGERFVDFAQARVRARKNGRSWRELAAWGLVVRPARRVQRYPAAPPSRRAVRADRALAAMTPAR